MSFVGYVQLTLFLGILLALTKPLGLYLCRVLDGQSTTFLDWALKPAERAIYAALRINPEREQPWKDYTLSMLAFSVAGLLFTYAILRLQHLLPLNPQGFGPVPPDLAFNAAASFATNTNWQNYAGETTLSYFTQAVGLSFHNFVSAAAGVGAAAALVRGISRHSASTVGNFWVDLTRTALYLLLPLCFVFSLFLISEGVIHNFRPYVKADLVEALSAAPVRESEELRRARGTSEGGMGFANVQVIAQGPAASQVAIKMLGTNGGGFFNANAGHPYENPTPLTNFVQMLSIFLIPSGLTYYLGRSVRKQRHGWAVWSAMAILFVAASVVCYWAESAGNPRLYELGVDVADGNMEGKEVRFGIFGSSLFAAVTTAASCGAVNAMHDSFTPIGGLIPLFNIQLGGILFGGVGSGLYGMLLFVVLAVFLTGLMVGRTPEYLGKKIEPYDVKVSVLALLVSVFGILGFAAAVASGRWGIDALGNGGPHGLTEILYAYSSATGNNGSALAGLNGNSTWWNVTLGLAMLFGRFFVIVPVMALAGNMVRKKRLPPTDGSFPVWGPTFVIVLAGTVLIVGALSFLPALALGPVVEHFLMHHSAVSY